MADTVNLYDAKTHLSELVERAAAGEEIVIAKAGRPKAKLVPFRLEPAKRRKGGFLRGKIWISPNFDDPLPPELLDAFEGRSSRKRK
ncbi:MAG TPA: type II toxin-antitoxin system prevent-host-death family antitoxin [Stellaceae bacterium]|nr:type II toxin-antitoxin system prevent-host-death family antitoxin [Stellaceae bacterium]